jgi:glycosyltransferase involved in cell wall biosynthesis
MRILLAHYRYFVSSGPERYLFNITKHLQTRGHEVMPFSIRYSQNEPSHYERYFVSPISAPDAAYFADHGRSLSAVFKGFSRLFYSHEVERAVRHMVADTMPDIAYVLCYLRKLSPSLLTGLKRSGVPVVVRLSDYGMFCAEHHLLRNGAPCTLCQSGNLLNGVVHKCLKGSLTLSFLDAAATAFHRFRGYFDLIDRFVTTNPFMSEMMVKAGYSQDKIVCIPTFTDLDEFSPGTQRPSRPTITYVGRLDAPKGVHVLIGAFEHLSRTRPVGQLPLLRIAGAGHLSRYVDGLTRQVNRSRLRDCVEFTGAVPAVNVPNLLRNSTCVVIPSICYENLPNALIESFGCGCPVIASDLGSLSYAISHGRNGLLFRPGDPVDLADQIARVVDDSALQETLAKGARQTAVEQYGAERHVRSLLTILRDVSNISRAASPVLQQPHSCKS